MRTTVWVEGNSVRYYDPVTGKKKRVYCDTRDQIKITKNKVESMLINRRFKRGNPNAMPLVIFGQYLEALATTHRKSTLGLKRASLEPFLSGMVRTAEITSERIGTWAADLIKKYKVDTVSIKLRDLRAFLRWCVKNEHLADNPFAVVIPASTQAGRRITPAELEALEKNMDRRFWPIFVLLTETGARRGEVLGMEWNELSLESAWWEIPAHKCKTKISRTIPLTDRAVEALRSILGPENTQPPQGRVFAGWSRFKPYFYWREAKKAAGIVGRLRLHDIRHTFASQFRGRRSSLKDICGWKSDVMADRYTHTTLDELREDMNK